MDTIIKYFRITLAVLGVIAIAAVAAFAAKGGFIPADSGQEETLEAGPGPVGIPGSSPAMRPPRGPAGEVSAVNKGFLLLHTINGRTLRVIFNERTIINRTGGGQTGNPGDIKVGDKIMVIGWPTNNGSFAAQIIQVLPDGVDLSAPPANRPVVPGPTPDLPTPYPNPTP